MLPLIEKHYVAGLILRGDTLTFERVLNRKDIYRFFP